MGKSITLPGHKFNTAKDFHGERHCECGERLSYGPVNMATSRANHNEHKRAIIREQNR